MVENGTGQVSATSIFTLLMVTNIVQFVIGLVYDTTASNSGLYEGAVAWLEKHLGRAVLKMPCRWGIDFGLRLSILSILSLLVS